jgi:hypothetical protein
MALLCTSFPSKGTPAGGRPFLSGSKWHLPSVMLMARAGRSLVRFENRAGPLF